MNYVDLNEEIRNGFFVDTKRKKIWNVELDLLHKLDAVCNKYNLKWFAVGGTLLGTVRHNGYIPWDDDLDIALSRNDFNKLCEVAQQEFNEPYFFQTALSDRNYFSGVARLRNSNTTGIITSTSKHKYNNGIFIDICVYDKIPEDKNELKKLLKKIKIYTLFLNNYYHFNSNNKIIKLFKPILSMTKYFISYEKLFSKYQKLCQSYKDSDSNLLGFLCTPEFIKETATVNGTSNLVKKTFESFPILVPKDYEDMLTIAYGEYMTFPPVEERGLWHEDIIIFDPDKPFIQYYSEHIEKYNDVLLEYNIVQK